MNLKAVFEIYHPAVEFLISGRPLDLLLEAFHSLFVFFELVPDIVHFLLFFVQRLQPLLQFQLFLQPG